MEICQNCQILALNNPASDPQAAGTRNGRSVSVTGLPSHSSAGAHAWQQGSVCHNHTFLLAHRSTRTHDVPPASKWAAMPFYERDPRIIRRHMDVMAWVDQADAQVGRWLDRSGWVKRTTGGRLVLPRSSTPAASVLAPSFSEGMHPGAGTDFSTCAYAKPLTFSRPSTLLHKISPLVLSASAVTFKSISAWMAVVVYP